MLPLWMLIATLAGCAREPEPQTAGPPPPSPPPGARRHAVLIVIDTLRADAVERASTPHLDALARDGSSAQLAWAPGTWTAPSVMSLFTGASVRQHGWDLPLPHRLEESAGYPPMPALPTLAERLRDLGFQTAGLYANPLLRRELGFDRGFQTWEPASDGELAEAVAAQVAGWGEGERHFLYVHLFGPHQPLRPSAGARERWGVEERWITPGKGFQIKAVRADKPGAVSAYYKAYHAAVEDTDQRLGQILASLAPALADTALVLTSDHGELLGEHGRAGHNQFVYEPLTAVPFIAVGTEPVPPQLSAAAAADLLTRALGLDLAWPIRAADPLPLVSQREGKLALTPDGRIKGIWDEDLRAYDLAADPGEERPLPDAAPALAAARAAWEAAVPAGQAGAAAPIDEGMREALEALGYVE